MRTLIAISAAIAFAAPALAQTTAAPPVGGQPSVTQPGGAGSLPNNAGSPTNPASPSVPSTSSVTSPSGVANPGANVGGATPSGPGSNAGTK